MKCSQEVMKEKERIKHSLNKPLDKKRQQELELDATHRCPMISVTEYDIYFIFYLGT